MIKTDKLHCSGLQTAGTFYPEVMSQNLGNKGQWWRLFAFNFVLRILAVRGEKSELGVIFPTDHQVSGREFY